MNSALDSYYRLAQRREFLLLTGLVYLASQAAILTIIHPLGSSTVFELQTSFSPDRFLEIIQQWEESGLVDQYRKHFTLDHIHPIWYSLFLSSSIASVFHRNQTASKYRWLLFVPFLAGLCDVVENLLHNWFLADLPRASSSAVAISASFSNLKWLLLALTLATIFIQLLPRKRLSAK